ncbi:MAG: HlyD family efflux transporter periplasmic adaptor subunit [Bacteroidales bacterium]|nr:HlyD family efflux transporter periplasmic adaptor subunit [Bacteroidales bacterium]
MIENTDKEEKGILYSEPVNEIMGEVPGPVVRWGNVAIFIVFLIFLVLSWLIKYPDRIPAPVEITTINPPVTLVSKVTGRIKNLYAGDKENVHREELIAVMETAASIDEITRLERFIDTLKHPEKVVSPGMPEFSELGELQEYWSAFMTASADYINYLRNDYYGNKAVSVRNEMESIRDYISRLTVKERLYHENISLEARKFSRDSLLSGNGVYSESELEKSKQSLIRMNIELQQVLLDQSEKNIELAEKSQLLQDYTIRRLEEKEKIYSSLQEAFLNLKAQVKIWKNTYLLVSPVDGIVTFTKFWSENQTVSKDETVLTIVPHESGDYIGRISLRMNRSGKVRVGQDVNIKFSGYPFLEYGMVKGIIQSKSLVPSGDGYLIELRLPDGLTTLYGNKLTFTQNMQGTAEIITDDLRLLEKIINPLRYLISRNRQ